MHSNKLLQRGEHVDGVLGFLSRLRKDVEDNIPRHRCRCLSLRHLWQSGLPGLQLDVINVTSMCEVKWPSNLPASEYCRISSWLCKTPINQNYILSKSPGSIMNLEYYFWHQLIAASLFLSLLPSFSISLASTHVLMWCDLLTWSSFRRFTSAKQ